MLYSSAMPFNITFGIFGVSILGSYSDCAVMCRFGGGAIVPVDGTPNARAMASAAFFTVVPSSVKVRLMFLYIRRFASLRSRGLASA